MAVGYAGDLEEQFVVGAVRAGILDGNVAIDAVILAIERDHRVLAHVHGSVLRDGYVAGESA